MAKSKIPGVYWDKETGKGKVDKRIAGIGRVFERFTASSWQAAEAEYHRIIAGARAKIPSSTARVFREAATKYLNEQAKRSLARDADCLANLDPWIGGLPLDHVHQGTLQAYVEHRQKQGIKSSTVRREISVARRVLTLAARVWRDSDNKPWLQTVPLLLMPDWKDAAQPYPLSIDEQRALLKKLPGHLAEMALFGLHTGAREGVICRLRWEWEVKVPEIQSSVFLVPGAHTKNGTTCLITLNTTARSIIDARRGRSGETVFGFRGKPVERMHNTAWKKAWVRAGLPIGRDVLSGPHNLRHTFARRLRMCGVPLETRKSLLHHIDGDITLHYSPAELRELVDAAERLCALQPSTLLRLAT